MVVNAENTSKLNLPYRVITLCTGDVGFQLLKPTTWKFDSSTKHLPRNFHVQTQKISKPVVHKSAIDEVDGKVKLHTLNEIQDLLLTYSSRYP